MSSGVASTSEFDLEDLLHLEQTFYDAGYTDGHAHGRIHGLIEGRALGREKGYQLWEEVGFYEGFAKLWMAACRADGMVEGSAKSRAEGHIRHLLILVSQFPRVNPSTSTNSQSQGRDGTQDADADGDVQVDIVELLNKMRARYKALCATLGVKPRLRDIGSMAGAAAASVATVEGVGDVSGTDVQTKTVWKLDRNQEQAGPVEMSF